MEGERGRVQPRGALALRLDAMDIVPFQRHRSWIESLGLMAALCVAIAFMIAAIETMWNFFLEPLPDAWREFASTWRYFVVGSAVVLLLVARLPRWLPQRRWLRWSGLAVAAVVAGVVGWCAQDGFALLDTGAHLTDEDRPHFLHTLVVLALLVSGMGEYRWRSQRAAAALHEAELNRIRLQGELARSRLLLLQAQIEPHFLFNSLANVRRLLRTDGDSGRAMLADLMRCLEGALPRMRNDITTLASEAEMIRAFLAVHQIRMGHRLRVRIDVAAELGARAVPPMMLMTLIENALKHGLGPLPEGGTIEIRAAETGGRLVLSVADTGRGLVAGAGGGTGLANIRARLKAMHGAAAGLSLRLNEPHGVVAEIALPTQPA